MSEIFSHYRVNFDNNVPEVLGQPATTQEATYIDHLNKNLKIVVTNLTEELIEFDISGIDVSIANALRRILLAEVSGNYNSSLPLFYFNFHSLFFLGSNYCY